MPKHYPGQRGQLATEEGGEGDRLRPALTNYFLSRQLCTSSSLILYPRPDGCTLVLFKDFCKSSESGRS